MDYKDIYARFIESRRNNPPAEGEYFERHHIMPRCMGGGDEPENLVNLSPEDHFFAHLVLAKAYRTGKLWAAVWIMMGKYKNKSFKNNLIRSWGSARKKYAWVKKYRPMGASHPMADSEDHLFYYIYGGIFRGTRIQFSDRFNIPEASVNTLFNGKKTVFCYGWSLFKIDEHEYVKQRSKIAKESGKQLKGFVRDKNKYVFYNKDNNESLESTQSGMVELGHLCRTGAWSLCSGNRYASNGWCLYENKDFAFDRANKIGKFCGAYNHKKYYFYDNINNKIERSTMGEMNKKYNTRCFDALVRGERITWKGWSVNNPVENFILIGKQYVIEKDGCFFKGTMNQIAKHLSVTKPAVWRLTKGLSLASRGWRLAS